jgi:isoleucyl-tRNA synthetase
MEEVLEIVVLGRACRNTANLKQRQPLAHMYVKAEKELPEFFRDIVADELNVKEVEFTSDVRSFTSYTFKPQLKTLGKRFGSRLNALRETLNTIDGNAAMDSLNETGKVTVLVDGVEEELATEDLLIESAQKEGYVSDADHGITVVIDTNLTDELIEEGFVRELISKVQTMRKDADFEVMDHIVVYVSGNEKMEALMAKNEAEIRSVVLADEVVVGQTDGITKEWNLNGEDVTIGVKRV